MPFSIKEVKGLRKCVVDQDLDPSRLTIHISEIGPGTRAHPPHTHGGVEAFYVLEGKGTFETGGERVSLGTNEAVLLDPTKLHGLVNTGSTPLRYMVIIARAGE